MKSFHHRLKAIESKAQAMERRVAPTKTVSERIAELEANPDSFVLPANMQAACEAAADRELEQCDAVPEAAPPMLEIHPTQDEADRDDRETEAYVSAFKFK